MNLVCKTALVPWPLMLQRLVPRLAWPPPLVPRRLARLPPRPLVPRVVPRTWLPKMGVQDIQLPCNGLGFVL